MSDLAIELYENFKKKYPNLKVSMDSCIDYVLQTGSTDANNFCEYCLENGLSTGIEK